MKRKLLWFSLAFVLFIGLFTMTEWNSAQAATTNPDIIGHKLKTKADYRKLVPSINVVDIDIRFTRDGVPVNSHDPKFGGRCNFPVKKYGWSKVAKLSSQRGCDLANLDYVAKLTRQNGKSLSLELKTRATKKQIKSVTKVLNKYGLKSRTTIYSFNKSTVARVQRLHLGVKTGLNTNSVPSVATVKKYGGRVAVNLTAVNQNNIKPLTTASGVYVAVFTINTPSEDAKFATLGADGVYTDTPVQTKENLARTQ